MPRKGNRPFRKTVVRYVGQDGKRCTSTTEGAVKRTEQTDTFYAKINGKVMSLETTDEATAWNNLNKLLRRKVEQDLGIRDGFTDAAELPLATHVDSWLATVTASGVSQLQIETLRSHVTRLASLAGWTRITDINADAALLTLARLQATSNDSGRPIAARTRNHYLKHLKQFVRWLVEGDKLKADPLRKCKPISVEDDLRHMRRVPSEDEVSMLFKHLAGNAPRRKGMTGPQRALGYKVSMATGFRANEVRDLDRECFDLEKGEVTLRASADKRRKAVVQPIPKWLVDELKVWFENDGGCWSGFPETFPGRLLKADLLAAGIEPVTQGPHGPLYLDFHSLRYYYISELASQEGISPKTLMELSRHSTPTLTLAVYAQAKKGDLRKAAEKLPEIGKPNGTRPSG